MYLSTSPLMVRPPAFSHLCTLYFGNAILHLVIGYHGIQKPGLTLHLPAYL